MEYKEDFVTDCGGNLGKDQRWWTTTTSAKAECFRLDVGCVAAASATAAAATAVWGKDSRPEPNCDGSSSFRRLHALIDREPLG